MLYLSPPSTPPVRDAMRRGLLGCITTPAQGNRVPDGVAYACDNGRFGSGWPGLDAWRRWLARRVERFGSDRCRWATAPDVPFDAVGALRESLPEFARIRALGVPAAFCAQGGSERDGMIPWDEVDVVFLAGGVQCHRCRYEGLGVKRHPKSNRTFCPSCDARITEWKLSPEAAHVADEARARGLAVHMGRVNSHGRLDHAHSIGCTTVDGTFATTNPDENLPRLLAWLDKLNRRQSPGVAFPLPLEGIA